MKYFKGIQLLQYPWVMFYKVAEFATDEDFEESEWATDPLVKREPDIIQVFGAYSYRIVDGEFVDRTEEELEIQESDYLIKNALAVDRNRIQTISDSSFTYDSNDFPMDEVSRLFYTTMEKIKPASNKIRTMANTAYALNAVDIPAFMDEYYKKLITISKHTV